MESLNNGMQLVGQHKYEFISVYHAGFAYYSGKFAWPHTGNEHGHDVLLMLYLSFYNFSCSSLNTVIVYFEESSCLSCLCPQLKPVYYAHVPQYYNKQLPMQYITVYII